MFLPNVFYGLLMIYSTLHNARKVHIYRSLYNADSNVEGAQYKDALNILAHVRNADHSDKKSTIRISILMSDIQHMVSVPTSTPEWKVYHNRYESDKLALYGPILKKLTHGMGG